MLAYDFDYTDDDDVYAVFCDLMNDINYWYIQKQQKTDPEFQITPETYVSMIYLRKAHLKNLLEFVEDIPTS